MLLKTMDSIFRSGYHIESRTLSNTVGTPGQGPDEEGISSGPCPDTPPSGLTSDFRESALGEQAGRRLRRGGTLRKQTQRS